MHANLVVRIRMKKQMNDHKQITGNVVMLVRQMTEINCKKIRNFKINLYIEIKEIVIDTGIEIV